MDGSPDDTDKAEARRQARMERYLEHNRGRPAIRSTPSAGLAVNRVMRPLASKGAKRGSSALALADIWPEIMGPRWSKISAPVRFRGSKEGRTLVISAPGPAASLILAASGQIIERLNNHLGDRHVVAIQVVQAAPPEPNSARAVRGLSPSEETALQDGLTKVEDNRLRAALERLGRAVIRHSD